MDKTTVREYISYNPDTGILIRRKHRCSTEIGKEVGFKTDRGYMKCKILGKRYLIHRVVWLYMTGEFPSNQIDHINHDRSDNRWCNLRTATGSQNQHNRRLSKNNKSGVNGVFASGDRWIAQVKHCNKVIKLGIFTTKEDAIKARHAADIKYGFHRNHGS